MTESPTKSKPLPRKRSSGLNRRPPPRRQGVSPAMLGIAAVVIVALLVVYAVWQTINASNQRSQPLEGLEEYPNVEQGHEEGPLTYEQTPPVGGIHNSSWMNCGVYPEPVRNENAVHSLEHGAIWITYRPDLPADQVQSLEQLTRQSGYRLLSPYPDLPSPIVASAWGYQIKLEQADDPRLQTFIARYEQNPLGPEPGAPCSGGLGVPA
jgi:hypothetical protein